MWPWLLLRSVTLQKAFSKEELNPLTFYCIQKTPLFPMKVILSILGNSVIWKRKVPTLRGIKSWRRATLSEVGLSKPLFVRWLSYHLAHKVVVRIKWSNIQEEFTQYGACNVEVLINIRSESTILMTRKRLLLALVYKTLNVMMSYTPFPSTTAAILPLVSLLRDKFLNSVVPWGGAVCSLLGFQTKI